MAVAPFPSLLTLPSSLSQSRGADLLLLSLPERYPRERKVRRHEGGTYSPDFRRLQRLKTRCFKIVRGNRSLDCLTLQMNLDRLPHGCILLESLSHGLTRSK